jgi:cell volume regulation protein A
MLRVAGAVLAASLLVALGAARTGLPVLVAFLGLGMLLGSDGPGGVVGLALILYR